MECRDAIELIREHLTELHQHSDIYGGGDCDVITALEYFAIPAMKKEICRDVMVAISRIQWGREYYSCPNCTDFIRWRYDLDHADYEPGRCSFCGQSLNWR